MTLVTGESAPGRWLVVHEKKYTSGLGSSGFKIEAHAATRRCRDVDQCIDRKARHTPAQEIVDPRLRHAAALGGFLLCPILLFEMRRNFLHQFGART